MMSFDFEIWKQAVLRSVDEATDRLDLLVASGLIEADSLEEAFEEMLRQIESEIAEEKRHEGDAPEGDRRG